MYEAALRKQTIDMELNKDRDLNIASNMRLAARKSILNPTKADITSGGYVSMEELRRRAIFNKQKEQATQAKTNMISKIFGNKQSPQKNTGYLTEKELGPLSKLGWDTYDNRKRGYTGVPSPKIRKGMSYDTNNDGWHNVRAIQDDIIKKSISAVDLERIQKANQRQTDKQWSRKLTQVMEKLPTYTKDLNSVGQTKVEQMQNYINKVSQKASTIPKSTRKSIRKWGIKAKQRQTDKQWSRKLTQVMEKLYILMALIMLPILLTGCMEEIVVVGNGTGIEDQTCSDGYLVKGISDNIFDCVEANITGSTTGGNQTYIDASECLEATCKVFIEVGENA